MTGEQTPDWSNYNCRNLDEGKVIGEGTVLVDVEGPELEESSKKLGLGTMKGYW